jgi:PIN domain nuclease of toxin-antitoxin system
VLDASALLALLQQEPGAEVVAAVLSGAYVSTVNWSEVIQKSLAQEIDTEDMQEDFESLGVQFVPFSVVHAQYAAQFWPQTRAYGLSLGDRACLALAKEKEAITLTTDQTWKKLKLDIDVQTIR